MGSFSILYAPFPTKTLVISNSYKWFTAFIKTSIAHPIGNRAKFSHDILSNFNKLKGKRENDKKIIQFPALLTANFKE
jgi:hypothetical protein